MYRRAFLVCAVAATAGCLDVLEENGEEITEPRDVRIVYDELVRDNPGTEDERVYVWGVARNIGERELSLVEIRATFYDDEDEELERVIENVPEVTEDEEWHFEIEFPDFGERAAAVDAYELEVITAV
ncbi:FxLYD domain-containing protein [Natronobiforma cellulositropha]|uniref:FxLYD domain-containing protein n=1 Tax=Natronobiforma cellulositropha TaxID=1679076 RepID=UPI0021D58681|nr:FxLYD domain-containing protein [Natronobiforma cellulositropha]